MTNLMPRRFAAPLLAISLLSGCGGKCAEVLLTPPDSTISIEAINLGSTRAYVVTPALDLAFRTVDGPDGGPIDVQGTTMGDYCTFGGGTPCAPLAGGGTPLPPTPFAVDAGDAIGLTFPLASFQVETHCCKGASIRCFELGALPKGTYKGHLVWGTQLAADGASVTDPREILVTVNAPSDGGIVRVDLR